MKSQHLVWMLGNEFKVGLLVLYLPTEWVLPFPHLIQLSAGESLKWDVEWQNKISSTMWFYQVLWRISANTINSKTHFEIHIAQNARLNIALKITTLIGQHMLDINYWTQNTTCERIYFPLCMEVWFFFYWPDPALLQL